MLCPLPQGKTESPALPCSTDSKHSNRNNNPRQQTRITEIITSQMKIAHFMLHLAFLAYRSLEIF